MLHHGYGSQIGNHASLFSQAGSPEDMEPWTLDALANTTCAIYTFGYKPFVSVHHIFFAVLPDEL